MAKKSTKPKREAKWARNTKDAERRAAETGKALSKEARKKIVAEGKKQAKQRRARIRDVGQAVPEGYARRQGGMYFALLENYRPDKSRNKKDVQAFANANLRSFTKDDGWISKASKQGMLSHLGELNLRKTTAAREKMRKAGLYGGRGHAGQQSKAIIYWGQDGKSP